MNTQTGGEIAATDTNRKPVPADGYDTRDIRPASRENRKPDGDDRDNGGYDHREIAPRDRRDNPPPPRSCRTVMLSFREADFAARPPCYR
jgi:hypothetical protein